MIKTQFTRLLPIGRLTSATRRMQSARELVARPMGQRLALVALAASLGLTAASCGSSSTLRNQQAQVQKKTDPFAVLDEQHKAGSIDPKLIEERLDAARQQWLRALAAQQRNDKSAVVRYFEESIETLNRLIYYPGVSENADFQALTASVIEDYDKFVVSLDVLPQNASVFALKRKFDEEMSKLQLAEIKPEKVPSTELQVELTQHPMVQQTLSYFTQGNGRPYMAKWLARTGKYFPMMRQIFKEEGVPEELIHLSMIESGLSPTATSWASAVGLWQFIQGTGSRYGLTTNWWLDRRRDPVHATRAAARHLRDLHDALGDWHLALASYNSGINRVRGAMAKSGSNNFWEIKPFLPKETQNYVPLYIAATLIARDPSSYGFHNIQLESPLAYDTVMVYEAIDAHAIGRAAGVSALEVKELNPELVQGATPPVQISGNGYALKLPVGSGKRFQERIASIPADQKMPWITHTVGRRETLKSIARTYGISASQLADYNNMSEKSKLRRGGRLRIPMSVMVPQTGTPDQDVAVATTNVQPVKSTTTADVVKRHVVKKGETLYSIAQKYGLSVGDLRASNALSASASIRRGQSLKIMAAGASTQNVAAVADDEETTKASRRWVNYKVRRGDTMGKIADAFDVSVTQLRKWNPKAKRGVRAGQTVKVYSNVEYAVDEDSKSVKATKGDTAAKQKSKVSYRVKRGDTLSSISSKYGVALSELKTANKLNGSSLRVGQRLVIPQ